MGLQIVPASYITCRSMNCLAASQVICASARDALIGNNGLQQLVASPRSSIEHVMKRLAGRKGLIPIVYFIFLL
jgi:hypothetical protein